MAGRTAKRESTTGAVPITAGANGEPGAANGNGAGTLDRVAIASAIRAFSAWLTSRDETVHAGALEPSDPLFRATIEFLRQRGIEDEHYDPDWMRTLDKNGTRTAR